MNNDEMIGRMKALLELNEQAAEENQRAAIEIKELALSLKMATREIEELRGIVLNLEKIMKESQRPDWVSTEQIAKDLSMHKEYVRQLYRAGEIPGYRMSEVGKIWFDRNEVYKAIKERDREKELQHD